MTLRRQPRLAAAFLALVAMLFMQLAVAAHACAVPSGKAAVVAEAVAGHECCEQEQPADPAALCQAHCLQGQQSLDKPANPVPVALASLPLPEVPVPAALAPPGPANPPLQASLLHRAAAPSVAVRHCCFRI